MKRYVPSPALAVAILALFVALGSGAYAQVANSIGTAQLRNRAVTHPKLAHNSVWHANLGRQSARHVNLANNSVWHANLGAGVVRRNNVQAQLLQELGPTRTAFGQPMSPAVLPTGVTTQLQPATTITTNAHERTVTAQAAIQLHNAAAGIAAVDCIVSLSDRPERYTAVITVGTPPAPNDVWLGEMTLIARWNVNAGTHTARLTCHPFRPATGAPRIDASARILLAATR